MILCLVASLPGREPPRLAVIAVIGQVELRADGYDLAIQAEDTAVVCDPEMLDGHADVAEDVVRGVTLAKAAASERTQMESGWEMVLVLPTCSASARLVKLYSNYVCDFVLFCLVAVVSRCFLPVIQYTVGESGTRDAPPCGCLPLSLFDLIAVPLSLLLYFIPLCGALFVLVLGLSSYLGCLALELLI